MCNSNIQVIFFKFGKALSIIMETDGASVEFSANVIGVFDGFFMAGDDIRVEAIKELD